MNAIGNCIQEVEQRIQQLQELHASLVKAVPLLASVPLPPLATQKRMVETLEKLPPKRKYTKRGVSNGQSPTSKVRNKPQALNVRQVGERPGVMPMAREDARSTSSAKTTGNPTTAALLAGKADTVVGAIKRLLLDESEPFTKEVLVENLVEDADYKKLYEAEGGKRALENALYQWTAAGRFKKDGDNYTVTAAGKEWFNK